MSLQDWLVVVSVVIIVAILVDGLRRMQQAKKDQLKMSRNLGGEIETSPLDDAYNPELPGGGARIVSQEAGESDGELLDEPLIAERDDEVDAGPASSAVEAEEEKQELILVINLHAASNTKFKGPDIKKLLEACGMNHGDMSIFHRHEEEDLSSPIQFSVANAVEPGYFDPQKMDELETPGVSFFMSLPGPKDFKHAYECMLGTAQTFAKNLGGDLKDESLTLLSDVIIEDTRARVAEFAERMSEQSA